MIKTLNMRATLQKIASGPSVHYASLLVHGPQCCRVMFGTSTFVADRSGSHGGFAENCLPPSGQLLIYATPKAVLRYNHD